MGDLLQADRLPFERGFEPGGEKRSAEIMNTLAQSGVHARFDGAAIRSD
jgi:hypothetical protein